MSKVISLREKNLAQIANTWEKIYSIFYWGLQECDSYLMKKKLIGFRKDAARLRKLYHIKLVDIKELGFKQRSWS